ncbi:hypothetical protein TrVFT333_011877 [Trichoderma virens FT-333]|nr:hypothetical protein TrVFT333_011877 [Trichoderma virens FT-333]
MPNITREDAVKVMDNISTKLREAIIKSMPCAFEHFVSENPTKMTVDRHEEVHINESRLVDSMVPLDKIMLGPRRKGVARSYYTALDTPVPRKTDIRSTEVNLNSVDITTRYGQANDFSPYHAAAIQEATFF